MDPLIAGVALAVFLPTQLGQATRVVLFAAVVLTAAIVLWPLRGIEDLVWKYPLIALGVSAFVALALRTQGLARILSLPPVAWLGKVSYGIYVYHQLVMLTVRELMGDPNTVLPWCMFTLLTLAGTVAISAASYYFFERPFLQLKVKFSPLSRPA